jgi:hypothetical protein
MRVNHPASDTQILLGLAHNAVKDEMQHFYAGLLSLTPKQPDDDCSHVNILDGREDGVTRYAFEQYLGQVGLSARRRTSYRPACSLAPLIPLIRHEPRLVAPSQPDSAHQAAFSLLLDTRKPLRKLATTLVNPTGCSGTSALLADAPTSLAALLISERS